jgi:hypothetical protein|mmetsp:Transcript_1277/g.3013  ORF Transcript_1277/g.3013 Transcript_1277/m.3013 type:complete len:109 (+) Transcript_1277:6734-7060(+)
MSTRTPSYVSSDTRRRTSHVAASRGPGLGHDDTAAAALAISSSEGESGRGGADVVDGAAADGSGGGGGDFVESPGDAPPIAGRGGGDSAGESHCVVKRGKMDGMIIFD